MEERGVCRVCGQPVGYKKITPANGPDYWLMANENGFLHSTTCHAIQRTKPRRGPPVNVPLLPLRDKDDKLKASPFPAFEKKPTERPGGGRRT